MKKKAADWAVFSFLKAAQIWSTRPMRYSPVQADQKKPNLATLTATIAPSDLSALGDPATQPHLQAFLSTIIDGKYRSFNAKWYERFNWIEYSQSKDLIFCKACRHFPEQHTEGTFTKEGFKNWKRIGQVCEKHQSSKLHASALVKLLSYKQSQRQRYCIKSDARRFHFVHWM